MPAAWQYALGPVLGAAIGYATNWVAVKMLFHPRREVSVLGLRFCGLIPRRREEITNRVAEIVQEELISREDMRALIESADLAEPIVRHAEQKIGEFLESQVARLPAFFRMMAKGNMIAEARLAIIREIRQAIPELTDEVIDAIEDKVDFRQLIIDKLNSVDIEKIEELVNRLARRELRSIELAGAFLGFLIGSIQSLTFLLIH